MGLWLIEFTRELGKEISFRSVELEGSFSGHSLAQRILNNCASTIEDLTITPHGFGTRLRSPLLTTAE